jgi:hypothetical protein
MFFRSSSYDDFGTAFQKAFYDSTLEEKLKKFKWKPVKRSVRKPGAEKKEGRWFLCIPTGATPVGSWSERRLSIHR